MAEVNRVVINIDVDDAAAQAKLAALEARLARFDRVGRNAGGSMGDFGDEVDRTTDSAGKLNQTLGETEDKLDGNDKKSKKVRNSLKSVGSAGKVLGTVFGRLAKFALFAGIEFAAMTVILGSLKLALVAGEVTARAFSASLTGIAAVAGLAVGALGTVLAAMREVSNAKMIPLARIAGEPLTGSSNMASNISALMGSRQLGMFKDATIAGAASSAYKSGFQADVQLRSMMETLGNFAIVAADPDKAMSSLVQTFLQARKEGAFTEDMIKGISEEAPQLGDAIKASGKGFEEFFGALQRGEIDSLKPFNDALDQVNNTLIGRFKGSLRVVKEQLTTLGTPLVDLTKGPLENFERRLRFFITSIQPAVTKAFQKLFPRLEGGVGGAMEKFFDYMTKMITTSLPKLETFGKGFSDWWSGFKSVFDGLGNWLERMSSGWDTLYENILAPLGGEIWKTIEHAIAGFNDTILSTSGTSQNFADRIEGIFDALRGLIDGFNNFRKAMAPVIDALLQILNIIGKLASNKLISTLLVGGFLGNRLFRKLPGGAGAKSGVSGPLGFLASLGGAGGSILGLKGLEDAKEGRNTILGRYSQERGNNLSRTSAMRNAIFQGQYMGKGFGQFMKSAGAGAGVVAAGIVGGLISGSAKKTDTTMQTVGQALAMGGTGAGIGMMVGGPVGAAIGGGVGLLAGGVMGFMGAKSAQEAEKKAARERAKTYSFEGLNVATGAEVQSRIEAIQGRNAAIAAAQKGRDTRGKMYDKLFGAESAGGVQGDVRIKLKDIYGLKNERFDAGDAFERETKVRELLNNKTIELTQTQKTFLEQMIAADKQYDSVGKSLELNNEEMKAYAEELGVSEESIGKLNATVNKQNFDMLTKAFGLSNEEVKKLAESTGKNLLTQLITLNDVVKTLGFTLDETGKVIDDAANRAVGSQRLLNRVLSPSKKDLEKIEGQTRYESAGESFFNLFGAGAQAVAEAGTEYLDAFLSTKIQEYIDNPQQDFKTFIDTANNTMQAQLEAARRENADPAIIAYLERFGTGPEGITTQLQTILGTLGTRMEVDPGFASTMQTMVNSAIQQFEVLGFANLDPEGQEQFINDRIALIEGFLTGTGVKVDEATKSSIKQMILAGYTESGSFQKDQIVAGFQEGSAYMVQLLEQHFGGGGGGNDTSSPRRGRVGDTASSRWGSTLGRHMAFSSMLPGNRTITSGVRNWGLGSPSSDHLTGRAYDLTGDNLGQYANMVNGAGGFAEFHGSAGSRHLHVVPPVGDSTTPALVSAMAASGGSTTNNYTINVNGGADPADVIARKVMDEIDRRERTNRERA